VFFFFFFFFFWAVVGKFGGLLRLGMQGDLLRDAH
jgi:hypothetical protein